MFRLLTVQKMAPSQDVYCKKIQPKDATYELKAQVKFNETTEGGVAGFVNFVSGIMPYPVTSIMYPLSGSILS